MRIIEPRYDGAGITNLPISIAQHFGAATDSEPLFDPLPLSGVDRILLLVVDGLGQNQLELHLNEGVMPQLRDGLRQGRWEARTITSTFPSTTAAALTSLYTGVSPSRHGRLGFSVFGVKGEVIDLINFADVSSGGSVPPTDWIGVQPTVFELLAPMGVRCVSILPRVLATSTLSRYHSKGAHVSTYDDLAELRQTMVRETSGEGPAYVMGYLPNYDTVCHLFGPRSGEAALAAGMLDELLADVLRSLRHDGRTLVLVVADHGLRSLDTQRAVDMWSDGRLRACLAAPPAGERTARYLSVREGADVALRDALSGVARVITTDDAWSLGYFGGDAERASYRWRVGSHIALPLDAAQLLYYEAEALRGGHGGLSPDEMLVPVLLHRS